MAVVRCPVCRGASRVAPDALGYRVECPRCRAAFVAAEEPPGERPREPLAQRPAKVIPIAPPRRLDALAPPVSEPTPAPPPDPEHDPHNPPPGGLPVSALVGMALMPFGIPLLWRIAPLVTRQEPALSIAAPVALAVAAAALCLGVVYTIDWTAATRVKGVLMLVGLSYLTAAGLYFLKRDLIELLQNVLGPKARWTLVTSDSGHFRVRMPTTPELFEGQPLLNVPTVGGRVARYESGDGETFTFLATASPPEQPIPDLGDNWFKAVEQQILKGGKPVEQRNVTEGEFTGREWRLQLADDTYRIVRVYAVKSRVYYLSVDGPNIDTDNDMAVRFFRSLEPYEPKPVRP